MATIDQMIDVQEKIDNLDDIFDGFSFEFDKIDVVIGLQLYIIYLQIGLFLQNQLRTRIIGQQERNYFAKVILGVLCFWFWPVCVIVGTIMDLTDYCRGLGQNPAGNGDVEDVKQS